MIFTKEEKELFAKKATVLEVSPAPVRQVEIDNTPEGFKQATERFEHNMVLEDGLVIFFGEKSVQDDTAYSCTIDGVEFHGDILLTHMNETGDGYRDLTGAEVIKLKHGGRIKR